MSRPDPCAVALETNMVSDSLTLMDLFGTLSRGGFAAFLAYKHLRPYCKAWDEKDEKHTVFGFGRLPWNGPVWMLASAG